MLINCVFRLLFRRIFYVAAAVSRFYTAKTRSGHEQLQSGRLSLAESGLAALRNRNAEPDILVCIMAWLLSTQSYPWPAGRQCTGTITTGGKPRSDCLQASR
jgi:hypothetical protein